MAKPSNIPQGNQLANEMVGDTMSWFKKNSAKESVNECTELELKIVRSLNKDNLETVKPKDKAQMLAYVSKTKDGDARLIQFSEGKPDSRSVVTVDTLLPFCTDEELAMFNRLISRLENAEVNSLGRDSVIGAKQPSSLH